MVAPNKFEKVKDLQQKLDNIQGIFLTDFQGIDVNDLRKIRKDLKSSHSSIEVVKNRLFRLAIKDKVESYPEEVLTGNTAVVLCKDEILNTAKILRDYARSFESFRLKGGFLNFKFMSKAEVVSIAALPPKPQMIGIFAGMLLSPIRGLVTVLSGSMRNLAITLDQIAKQKENFNK